MATLRIPPVLRTDVGGARTVDVDGATVQEALDDLFRRHPATRGHLLAEDGTLNRFVNVYVGEQDIRLGDGLSTPLAESEKVIILPAMAGG
jgi:molybdopterin synthase sulfur carrier subunit